MDPQPLGSVRTTSDGGNSLSRSDVSLPNMAAAAAACALPGGRQQLMSRRSWVRVSRGSSAAVTLSA